MRRPGLNRTPEGGAQPRFAWMLTFSDLCTLLLTFFVLLLSMSSLNKKAYESTFGHLEKPGSTAVNQQSGISLSKDRAIREMSDGIQKSGSMKVLDSNDPSRIRDMKTGSETTAAEEHAVFLEKNEVGDRFSFVLSAHLLFEKGGAVINPDTYFILEAMGSFLHESNYRAHVDAHSSASSEIQERFASPDELAVARGCAVLSFLVNSCKVSPERLSLGCYGSARPVADNRTSAGRAMNQRIEIVFEKAS